MRTPPSLRAWAEGALVMAALVPWAVVSGLYGVVFLSSLAGYNSKGEEGETVLVAVLLGGVSVAACVVAAHMVANRTRLSSVGGFAVAGILTIAWAALIPSLWSSGIPLISGLPWAITMMILTGFTVPVAILGFVGLITVAVVRRVRHRTVEEQRTSGARLG